MRPTLFVVLALSASALAVVPAARACEVFTVSEYPDINYTTLCEREVVTYGDGTQTYTHHYLLHVMHAAEADPAFDVLYVEADQGSWVYDDGEIHQQRDYTHVGSGAFEGARGLVGTGYQANLMQRDQTSAEDAGDACSSYVGKSTCAGGSAWFTVQDVASVGAGFYYQQQGTGADCREAYEVDLDAGGVVFLPVTTGPQACTTPMPWLSDDVPFDQLP